MAERIYENTGIMGLANRKLRKDNKSTNQAQALANAGMGMTREKKRTMTPNIPGTSGAFKNLQKKNVNAFYAKKPDRY